MKKKLFALLFTVALGASALTGCGQAAAAEAATGSEAKNLEKITFCLDWTPNTNHTGLYVAQEMGFYEAAGLEVEIVQPPEGGATLMCASGQAQFAIGCQDSMASSFDLEEPIGVTSIAAVINHNTSGIVSRAGEGLDRPKGFEGKTYSSWESPIELKTLESVITTDGGDFSKVTMIPNTITDEPAALAAHQTDAIWVFYGWGVINADVEGVDVDYWNFADIDPVFDFYTPTIIVDDDFLKENPETVRKFLEATKQGYEYAISNPKEAADMLIAGDTTGSLNGCEELVYKSQEWISTQYIADGTRWGYMEPERWDGFYGWLFDNGLTTKDLRGVGYTNDYLPE